MSNLMLHCGGEPIEYDALRTLPEPEPAGPRHVPVAYHRFVDEVLGGLAQHQLPVTGSAYGLAKKGKHLFGLLTIDAGTNDGTEVSIGIRSSVDKTLPMSLAIGNRVFVCDNLAFCGEFVLTTRSTKRVFERLPYLVFEAIRALTPFVSVMTEERERWAQDMLPDFAAERLMIAAVRTGMVPSSKIERWITEYENPTAVEHAQYAGSKLGLYHAATAALRPINSPGNLSTITERTLGLRSMFNWDIDRIAEWERPRMGGRRVVEVIDDGKVINHDAPIKTEDQLEAA